MTTIATIADEALDAVAADITDAVHTAVVTRVANGAYNFTTGAYAETPTETTGRGVLATERPIRDVFPNHIIGPKDQLWLLEGFTSVLEGDDVAINSVDYKVAAVQNIGGAGTLFYAVLQ